MESTNSSNAEVSPKQGLPTKSSFVAETKPSLSQLRLRNEDGSPSSIQKVIAEFLGTFILVYMGCGAALTNNIQKLTVVGIAIVWGVVLMALIYAFGHVSGAHFNPAVSIALAAGRKFSWKNVPMYVLAQLLGATLASVALKLLFHHGDNIEAILTQYSKPTTDLEAFIWEFIITFTLVTSICAVATDHRASNHLCGVAISGTLLVNAMVAGPITGASMNPARSIGPAIVSGDFTNLWVYILAPLLGGVAAVVVYSTLRVPDLRNTEEGNTSVRGEP